MDNEVTILSKTRCEMTLDTKTNHLGFYTVNESGVVFKSGSSR